MNTTETDETDEKQREAAIAVRERLRRLYEAHGALVTKRLNGMKQ